MTEQPLTAVALVATDQPERYAKQLAAHLGRRAELREEGAGTRILLAGGDCLLSAADGVLRLDVSASDEESLGLVTDVVGRHLERFGRRNELQVEWRPSSV